jgi:lipopolysaccharide/colanic/teichoic acid biosynthesis glycosyltransferase
MLKRLFDIAGALAALCIVAPLLLPIALWVVLDSRGPVLYRARRIGRHHRPFAMYKFRTMVADAARRGPALTYQADPRITRAGRFLRRTHLDELPQLFNVLKGDMSLVGPRPEAPDYVDPGSPVWRQVLSVRPGICGLSQLAFATAESAILSRLYRASAAAQAGARPALRQAAVAAARHHLDPADSAAGAARVKVLCLKVKGKR